jgi:hypothetical protein
MASQASSASSATTPSRSRPVEAAANDGPARVLLRLGRKHLAGTPAPLQRGPRNAFGGPSRALSGAVFVLEEVVGGPGIRSRGLTVPNHIFAFSVHPDPSLKAHLLDRRSAVIIPRLSPPSIVRALVGGIGLY